MSSAIELTADEVRGIIQIANNHHGIAGAPLFVPQLMYDDLRSAGVDMTHIRAVKPIPMSETKE